MRGYAQTRGAIRQWAPLVALGLAGCFASHPRETPEDYSEAGSRLRVVTWVPEDGERDFVDGLYDTELETDCRFAEASDGSLRCFPTVGVPRLFADGACTEPVAPVDWLCGAELVSVGTEHPAADGCGFSTYTVAAHRVGAARALPQVFAYRDGECVTSPIDLDDYVTLTPIAADALVRADVEVAPREGDARVGARWYVADDGTTYWESYFDHEREEVCAPHVVAEGPAPCLSGEEPGQVAAGGDACDERYATLLGESCPSRTPEWFLAGRFGEPTSTDPDIYCGGIATVSVYRAGEPATPSNLVMCNGFDPGGRYFEAIPADDEVAWLPNERLGTGRLRLNRGHPRDRRHEFRGLYFDTELGVDCKPATVDGALRCAPALAIPVNAFEHFADPACERPAHRVGIDCPGYVQVRAGGRCSRAYDGSYYRIGDVIDAVFERDETGACRAIETAADDLFRGLVPIAPEDLVTFRRVER